jgi:hypothetical protein
MEKIYSDKIANARKEALAQSQPTQPKPFSVSEDNKKAMDQIMNQMASAQAAPAPSENTKNVVSDYEILDDAFKDMVAKPSLRIGSVGKRKEIESRCGEVKIDELFVSGELRQLVQIRPNRLEIVYRTLKGKEDLYIKRRLNEVRDENIRYAEDRFLYMLLCAHVQTYNGKKLPGIFDDAGNISDSAFDERFNAICEIPQVLIEEVWVNYVWFEQRVRRALEGENLKGG